MPQMILHPTDFSLASEVAFAHALRFALDGRGLLSILHVEETPREDAHWDQYPRVREVLERWGLLPADSPRSAVADKLGVNVEKIVAYGTVASAVAGYVEQRPMELVVLATEGREGSMRWLLPSIAEPVGRQTGVPSLFVPGDGRRLVEPSDGSVRFSNLLVAVAHDPAPGRGLATALHTLRDLGGHDNDVDVHVLHVGDGSDFPEVGLPEDGRWRGHRLLRDGDPGEVIPAVAGEIDADLVVVVTAGHHGFMDALRGSTSEQVVRRSPCAVLSVPAEF